jgi:hypothetical protein
MDDTIAQMVRQRREALHGTDAGQRAWGLALSGGGIRSATFCLGLLKALAQRRQLLRFDLMSTVSGGGYVGAMLGRLCTRAADGDDVRAIEGALAEVDKVRLGWWLRANGRYLIPGGMRDTLFAAALYLRNLLGTHIELAIAAMLTGALLATVNLLMWEAMAATVDLDGAQAVDPLVVQATRLPTLWLGLVVPWVLSIVLAQAYWSVRDRPSWFFLLRQLAMWGIGGALAWVFRDGLHQQFGAPRWLAPLFAAFAAGWVLALVGVAVCNRNGAKAGVLRNRLTGWLASLLMLALVLALLGLLDWAAWWFAAHTQKTRASWGGVLLVGAAGLRGVLPLLLSGKQEAPGIGRQAALALASVVGLVVAFVLAAWWIGVFYAGVLLPVFTPAGLDFARGWVWLAIVGGVVAAYALLTGRNFAFLNLSSLHMFYKARIVRGYLGAANARRLGADPLAELSTQDPPDVPVGEVDPGDDIAMRQYAPHRGGGPVHLVNVCVNQTHDPRQRLFNRDRKSLPLTVAPLGWMQAAGTPWTQARGDGAMTLGAWAAISGAAVSAGLGRLTRRGLAALSVFAGLRLGYWWNSREAGLAQRGAGRRAGGLVRKTHFMLLECFGAFPGSSSPDWYLSDGGHFENTGAYALLQQECELVVIADCGADPDYRFCDIENLIRRARIDLHADIDFLKPSAGAGPGIDGVFGSLGDLASQSSQACLALAQVRYASGRSGRLVLVKPNMSAELPVDLVNFKAAHPLFPQQPTTDQFFDEAQWESYFRLGAEIGHRLEGDMLARVAGDLRGLFEFDDGQAARAVAAAPAAGAPAAGAGAASAAIAVSRLQARVLRAGAVTASLGLGTAATLGVAAWQGIDTWRTQNAEKLRAESLAFKDLTERWSRLRVNAPPGEAPASLAAELLRTGDLLCREGGENFMANFRLSVRIVDDAKAACQQELDNAARATGDAPPARVSSSPACARLLDPGNGIDCLQAERAPACAPRYWARDYSGLTPPQANCSGFASGASSMVAAIWGRLRAPFEVRFRDVEVVDEAPTTGAAAAGASPSAGAVAPSGQPYPAPAVEGTLARPPAESPAHATPAVPSPPVLVTSDACRGKLVYIQAYGPEQREAARALREPWRALGATVPPIEDVLASSRNAGRAPPAGYAQPTIVFHDAASQPCARLLAARGASAGAWALRPLPARLKATPGTLEVWLPRATGYAVN